MFANNILYMCTFSGNMLWVCGFASNSNWQQVAEFTDPVPIKTMIAGTLGAIVVDQGGALWRCELPHGVWVQDIPQPPFTFKEFMGTGVDLNQSPYIAALDTGGRAWLIGNPTFGGNWVELPNLRPPGTDDPGKDSLSDRQSGH
jgi:hypothetical protein